jgi:hypothetical protein
MSDFRGDRYTKTILTVIAGALLWLCASGDSVGVSAQRGLQPTPVVVVGWSQMSSAGLSQLGPTWQGSYGPVRPVPLPVGLGGTAYNGNTGRWSYDPQLPLPVTVRGIQVGEPVPVAVRGIQTNPKAWDPIKTEAIKTSEPK